MYNKFGEFDSWEELNIATEGQKTEGDEAALKDLAKENGIDIEDAEDYFDGALKTLCNPMTAALGKIKVEVEDIKPVGGMKDWVAYINTQIHEDENFAIAVRHKGKNLIDCIYKIMIFAEKNQYHLSSDLGKQLAKAAGITKVPNQVTFGIPESREIHMIIRQYYLGGDS